MRIGRKLLVTSLRVGVVLILALAGVARAQARGDHIQSVTAITEVFGDGLKLSALAVEYNQEIDASRLSSATFAVDQHTVTRVYANTHAFQASPDAKGRNGRYVIVELSPEDAQASLYVVNKRDVVRKPAKASVIQSGTVYTTAGANYPASRAAHPTQDVINRVVDDFRQFEFRDAKTGGVLKYNLFIPRNYDAGKSYPLVLFMHDAGATSEVVDTTLVQGLGAVVWATPADQARHEAFVLAPQYASQIVNDNSEAGSELETTVDLINALAGSYRIDRDRIYATGQSGGAMMSIAMNIKYPDLFAASFLVAGQWDASKVQVLASDKLWIVVSEGDLKAYPGQNAITAELEKHGARISRAVWDGRSTADQFATAFAAIDAEHNPINYVALAKGTVVPPGQDDDGGSNHVNTWRIAYTIDGIRDWIFRQRR